MGNVRIPVKESSLKKKEKIIDVGFRLMCEKGYHNVTCIDIAAAASVSTGIIYQYFKDKLDIFVAGANKHMKEIMFPMLDILDNVTITRNNFKKVLKQIIEEKLNLKANYIFKSIPKFMVLTNRLCRLLTLSIVYIVQGLQATDFEVVGNEIEFKNGKEYKPIEITTEDGRKVEITGKIDRIDLAKYATGK